MAPFDGDPHTLMSIDCARFCAEVRVCCTETEMTLTRADVERIKVLGHSAKDYLVRVTAGFCELKNVDGYCYFYDRDSKKCQIYDARPEGCRWYPIIYNARSRKCAADEDCPAADTVTRNEIRKVSQRVRTLVETLRREAASGESPC